MTTTRQRQALTEYQAGYLDALWDYAHWKDGASYVGASYVGSTGTTYQQAKEWFLREGRIHADPGMRDLRNHA